MRCIPKEQVGMNPEEKLELFLGTDPMQKHGDKNAWVKLVP